MRDITVTGKVTDETGLGLQGVSVIIKGTTLGQQTDVNGNYRIVTPDDAVLIFRFIGYGTKEEKVDDRTTINVQMQPETS